MRIKLLSREDYRRHLDKYGQYSRNPSWNEWYSRVAGLKGARVAKTILNYKGSGTKVMDLGCGIGVTLSVLAQVFPDTVGVDVFEKEVRASRELLRKCGLRNKVIKYDGKRLPFRAGTFDVVTSIEVIEHADNPGQMLSEIRRVLKPDGILHITTANKLWPIEPHFKLLFLSYLPKKWADWYVKAMGRGNDYQNIHLPTYGQFKSQVEKYFTVSDVTLEAITNYKKYGLDEERGKIIVWVGGIIRLFGGIRVIELLLLWSSLGWLFIAMPKHEKH